MCQVDIRAEQKGFKYNIKKIIYERSLQILSQDTDIPMFKLNDLLEGKTQMRLEELEIICRALKCSPSDVLQPQRARHTVDLRQKDKKKFDLIKTFLKVREAAELYGIGRCLIYTAIHNKELKAYKPNCRDFLIKVTELEDWIQSKYV